MSVSSSDQWLNKSRPWSPFHRYDEKVPLHDAYRTDYIHSLESPTCRVWQQAVNSKVQSQFYSRSQWLFVWSVQWLRWGRERSIFWCFAGLNWSHTSIINTSQACMRAMHSVRQSEQQTATTPPCTREEEDYTQSASENLARIWHGMCLYLALRTYFVLCTEQTVDGRPSRASFE